MSCPDARTLAQSFWLTHHIIRLQTDGLSHTDSVLQPPFRGNCLNWVVGHIIQGRDSVLALLGETSVLNDADAARYGTDSEPITKAEMGLPLKDLLHALDRSQERITARLDHASSDQLEGLVHFRGREQTLAQAIAGLHWHETYHTGQLELLRQLAGTNDTIL